MARTLVDPNTPPPWMRGKLLALVVLLGTISVGAMIYRECDATPETTAEPGEGGAGGASDAEAIVTRCERVEGAAPVVIGEPPPDPPPAEDAGAGDVPGLDIEPEETERFVPFALVVGRGAATESGYAVGSLERADGGTVAAVHQVGESGVAGSTVRLGEARGDVEAPALIRADGALFAAMLELRPEGRALLVAKVTGERVQWAPELHEGSDESLAIDLAVSGDRLAVVWDDLDGDDVSRIELALLATKDLAVIGEARPITGDQVEAEVPRLVPREGGFWLSYIARRAEPAGSVPRPPPEERDEPAPKDEVDERRGGEVLSQTWLEVVPLSADGVAQGSPREVTPRDGHVLAYDVAPLADGGLLLAWRDERSPVGGTGGAIGLRRVGLAELGEPEMVQQEDVEAGVPQLVGQWLAVAPLRGAMLLAPIDPGGTLAGPLLAEPALGRAQPIAANGDKMLVGSPAGRAMKLSLVSCNAP